MKLEDAKQILNALNMPIAQQSDMCCYVLLALCDISENSKWIDSNNEWKRIHDLIAYINSTYGVKYAENTRETIRKIALHHFRNAAIVEDNGVPTNSPRYRYRITDEALILFKAFNSKDWVKELASFTSSHETLINLYASKKEMTKMPVKINGSDYELSTGSHNLLQKSILEEFAPRFAPNCECLYIGDSTERDLYKNVEKLSDLGMEITLHDKMPDVVLYVEDKKWLYFIEAVTSVGPMSPARIKEIEEMTTDVECGKIYITAFPDFKTFKKFSEELAWETEVWISDMPEHMIHLNGDKFMGPR